MTFYISEKGGVLAFEPDDSMYKKASNLQKTIKNSKKSATKTALFEYRGFQISKALIEKCVQEEELHRRKSKPQKRKNPLTYRESQVFDGNSSIYSNKISVKNYGLVNNSCHIRTLFFVSPA